MHILKISMTRFPFEHAQTRLRVSTFNMARYRQSLNLCVQEENEGQNICSFCFATTKYSCLHCAMPICNKCSVFEDNEEASGWAAGKRVGYCEPCNEQLGRGHKPITEENQARQAFLCKIFDVLSAYRWSLKFFLKLFVKCI